MSKLLHLGLDVGSTTVKQVYIDSGGNVVHASYQRHFSDVRATLAALLQEAAAALPGVSVTAAMTGSAGMSLASSLQLPFVQEVIASTIGIRRFIPRTDVAIELGGEDAKITFFDGSIDQRMNETCAGGTGAFIDQMASFLKTDAAGLDELAKAHTTIYPIAARCGVFAKTDIMPLLNEGAAREDIAASIFQAVVDQTVGGLACGRAIKGNIAFLGGPLFFLSQLRKRFIETLELSPEQVIFPEQAQLFVALGAALESASPSPGSKKQTPILLADLARTAADTSVQASGEAGTLPPLFTSDAALASFRARHESHVTPRAALTAHEGPVFIGFDIGSTTIKAAVIDDHGTLLHSHYEHSQGEPLAAAVKILKDIYGLLPQSAYVARAAATGYGGSLIRTALGADFDEVETVAHYRAAKNLHPNVSFILDIGGQDMKCLHVEGGVIDRIMLNEACSAGCGVFIETFAKSLGMTNGEFISQALTSRSPVDLGSRCTVFMNSKVKQAQKEGAGIGDIAAGLAYSVIRNALYKVIKAPSTESLGAHVVAQGGAFLNDALLRAFELLLGREIFRPDISGLMGAYGVALIARDQHNRAFRLTGKEQKTGLLSRDALEAFSWKTRAMRCKLCSNRCLLTLSVFNDGRRHVSGNRCEKGAASADQNKAKGDAPNLYKYKYRRLFDYYTPLEPGQITRGVIGIPRALNMFENYPFWFTFFTRLGYRVELSAPSSKELYNEGLSTIPSQTACFPAKLAHGHILDLVDKGIKNIFFPCIAHEYHEFSDTDSNFNCPVVTGYPELLNLNMDALAENGVTLHIPFLPLDNEDRLIRRLKQEMPSLPDGASVKAGEIREAVKAASKEMKRFRKHLQRVGSRVLAQVLEGEGTEFALILAGHPYHVDPGINHGIADMVADMGVTVLTEDSVAHLATPPKPLRVVNQWTYHARLYRAAALAALYPKVGLVQFTSFGCGLDAVTSDQVQEILEESGRIYTLLKIDEGANLGAARIRIRSLLAAEWTKAHTPPLLGDSRVQGGSLPIGPSVTGQFLLPRMEDVRDAAKLPAHEPPRQIRRGGRPLYTELRTPFTEDMRKTHTILVPQLSPIHFQFVEDALGSEGYKVELLPKVDREAVEAGLRYVNNDVCYPALLAVGQLMQAVESGRYDPDKVALIISQTGGGCRATNYIAFLRKALADAGLSRIPVLSFNISGLEENPGFRVGAPLLKRVIRGMLYGDLLSRLFYRIRPYEKNKGETLRVLDEMTAACKAVFCSDRKKDFIKTVQQTVDAFAAIPVEAAQKPRVGIVGEIYLKYNPDANNNVMDIIEAEGGEAVPGDMTNFVLYCLYDDIFRASHLSGSLKKALKSRFVIWWIENLRNHVRKALAAHPRFGRIDSIYTLAKRAEPVVHLGHQTGEGWLLTGEMLELIESGVPNIICLQPFACLPNHITGKGVIKELKRLYPLTNIAAVDYDSGASEVNQLNRIKLMMAVAHKNMNGVTAS